MKQQSGEDVYELVKKFHVNVRGKPPPEAPLAMSALDKLRLVEFVTREMLALLSAETTVDQVVALLDIAGLGLESAVSAGHRLPSRLTFGADATGYGPTSLSERKDIVSHLWDRCLGRLLLADDVTEQGRQMLLVSNWAFRSIEEMGLRPLPLFAIAHKAKVSRATPYGIAKEFDPWEYEEWLGQLKENLAAEIEQMVREGERP